ncbi:DUF3267 domain-containing protein [Staphylococcus devriesei]|uniref:DUF3267 domain-containing protein n=1 Tax=Staphylococcus devriesei TaxID=586733 RepID=A0A2K4DM90_9STAP|nr:DUF3267 domain-containing protein [Staphylococcus devriesei]MCE5090959.1 DUF3267 domain-containing protein [Staphylococcus devriesei]MCE5098016.1 DUF3267 domain-containing protein [Staphylococcus devriesei]PNZ87917.1 permease [Staphylococcus devriesei]PTE72996.1 DUF3267 domain-containing protein [Staphylococcus devriesei]PTF04035.1 DUF3267 domain-containing protein [Staphylococcus devriesei]
MHKIDLLSNKLNLPKFIATQIVVILFVILITYKWAFTFTEVSEQTFIANVMYGILGFILTLGLHELIHRLMFYAFSHGEHPRITYQQGVLLTHSSNKYFNKWQYCTIMLAPMVFITASLMVVFSYYSYSSIIFISSIHIGYCLIDVYLVGITLINKFNYIHPSEEGLYMYYHKPLHTHNHYE